MRFEIIIDAEGNDNMKSRTDVAFALDAIARKLRNNSGLREGPIHDLAGSRVGLWTIEDDEDTGVHAPVRAMVENLFHCETPPGEEIRASGETICDKCNQPYRKHPYTRDRDRDGNPWLHRLCDGRVVKL